MECPEKWESVGHGLRNLQTQMRTEQVIAACHLMAQEVQRLGLEKGIRCLYELERKERAQVTLTAKTLLRRPGPRDIPVIQALWLVMRCHCAGDFLGQLFPPLAKSGPVPEMDDAWDEGLALIWLLTEQWDRRSDHWLKLVALEWMGPYPFYGLEESPEGQ